MNSVKEEPNPATRLISGSEVSAYQSCETQWWFKFRAKLQPLHMSKGLFRGTVGHEMLSVYYRALKEGNKPGDAAQQMREVMALEIRKNTQRMQTGEISPQMASDRTVLCADVSGILEAYLKKYEQSDYQRYEVVEVEQMHVSGNFFAMRLDLLMRNLETGELELFDHKFVSSFYEERVLGMNSQLPRYMQVLIGDREEVISKGYLNQLRTTTGKDGSLFGFERAKIPYNEVVADRRIRDQEEIADEIREHYYLSPRKSLDKTRRNLSEYTCKFCAFIEPCKLDLAKRDKDFRNELNMNYERSTYGYN